MKKLGLVGLLLVSVVLTGCGGGGSTSTYPSSSGNSGNSGSGGSTATVNATPKGIVQSSTSFSVDETTKTTANFTINVAGGQQAVKIGEVDFVDTDDFNGISDAITEYKKLQTSNDMRSFLTVENEVMDYGHGDNDYLSFGMWVYTSVGEIKTPEMGAYVDGGDPFTSTKLTGLTGIATYEGEADAQYASGPLIYDIEGDVTLTANFDAGTILGEITDIDSDDIGRWNGATIKLKEADITSQEGGFWTGDTRVTNNLDNSVYEGQWGGKFYGNATDKPRFAAGTFGGSAVANTDAEGSFVGHFVTTKN